ncbi:MAG TPA: hypothetical protein VHF92_08235 [Geodermatophilus sp.]|nr:hypothetical protein [Geodermatophilus sp.]
MQTFLAILTLVAAVGVLLPAFFITWWLAGSDDEALNPVAPLLGLGLFVAAIATVVVAARLDPEPTRGALAVMAAPAVLLLLATPFAGNRAHGRAPFREVLPGLALLSLPPLLALATLAIG